MGKILFTIETQFNSFYSQLKAYSWKMRKKLDIPTLINTRNLHKIYHFIHQRQTPKVLKLSVKKCS